MKVSRYADLSAEKSPRERLYPYHRSPCLKTRRMPRTGAYFLAYQGSCAGSYAQSAGRSQPQIDDLPTGTSLPSELRSILDAERLSLRQQLEQSAFIASTVTDPSHAAITTQRAMPPVAMPVEAVQHRPQQTVDALQTAGWDFPALGRAIAAAHPCFG